MTARKMGTRREKNWDPIFFAPRPHFSRGHAPPRPHFSRGHLFFKANVRRTLRKNTLRKNTDFAKK